MCVTKAQEGGLSWRGGAHTDFSSWAPPDPSVVDATAGERDDDPPIPLPFTGLVVEIVVVK